MEFAFLGWNTTIEIGNGIYIKDSYVYMHNRAVLKIDGDVELLDCHFSMWGEASLKIGERVSINKAKYDVGSGAIVDLGERCHFAFNGSVILRKNSSLSIGAGTTMGINYMVGIGADTRCVIGEDCMFANDICLRTNDGHTIFDTELQRPINYREKQKEEVRIGNHVWIGMRVTILYDTNLGDGSIVGASSLVKCKVPNNVLVVGIPAKIKRKNVAWTREDQAVNILSCGEKNIKFTEYDR